MKALTLRNLPPDLVRFISRKAKAERTSLNRTVIGLLEDCVAGPKSAGIKSLNHDLDHLAGKWTAEEASAFDAALASQRQVDPELWK